MNSKASVVTKAGTPTRAMIVPCKSPEQMPSSRIRGMVIHMETPILTISIAAIAPMKPAP